VTLQQDTKDKIQKYQRENGYGMFFFDVVKTGENRNTERGDKSRQKTDDNKPDESCKSIQAENKERGTTALRRGSEIHTCMVRSTGSVRDRSNPLQGIIQKSSSMYDQRDNNLDKYQIRKDTFHPTI
jgi:hypothetical protein